MTRLNWVFTSGKGKSSKSAISDIGRAKSTEGMVLLVCKVNQNVDRHRPFFHNCSVTAGSLTERVFKGVELAISRHQHISGHFDL